MTDFNITDYPAVLPLPQLRSHALKRQDPVQRSKMESGRIRARRKFKKTPTEMPATWLLDSQQLEIFKGWHHHILKDGAIPFRMRIKHGSKIELLTCRFLNFPDEKAMSFDKWQVKAKIQIEWVPVITEQETLQRIYGVESIQDSLNNAIESSVDDYVTPDI